MSLTLYYVPKTRSSRPRWILEEIGVPYELVRLEPADTKKAVYLADKYGDGKLAPAPGTSERGLYYQWILFAMASIEPHLSRFNELPAASNGDAAEREREAKSARDHLGVVERALAGHEFIVGDRFTAADVVLASVCSWAKLLGLTEGLPECDAYARRLLARPAAKRGRES